VPDDLAANDHRVGGEAANPTIVEHSDKNKAARVTGGFVVSAANAAARTPARAYALLAGAQGAPWNRSHAGARVEEGAAAISPWLPGRRLPSV
jgi:hypothetical protein